MWIQMAKSEQVEQLGTPSLEFVFINQCRPHEAFHEGVKAAIMRDKDNFLLTGLGLIRGGAIAIAVFLTTAS